MTRLSFAPRALVTALVCATFLGACANDGNVNRNVGTIVGAGVGAAVGSRFGEGTGKTLAIVLGTAAGAMLGNEIGRRLDERDRQMAYNTTQNTLETRRTGTTGSWNNPDSGHRGTVTPVRTYTNSGQPCREYTTTVVIDGRVEEARGTACRDSRGVWRISS
ncbi:MAG: RT0821/Lpp0805 family surface protein [Magnetospiraceae bacterium]